MNKGFQLYLDIELYEMMQKKYPDAVSAKINDLMAEHLKIKQKSAVLDAKDAVKTNERSTVISDYDMKKQAHGLVCAELGLDEKVSPRLLDESKRADYQKAFNRKMHELKNASKNSS